MILDKNGKPLSLEEEKEFENDVWDAGIPMSNEDARILYEKWGERLGIPKEPPSEIEDE